MSVCPYCGYPVKSGESVCPVCGMPIPKHSSPMLGKAHHSNIQTLMIDLEGVERPLSPVDLAQIAQLLMDEGTLRYSRSPKPVHDIYGGEYWGYYPRCTIGKYDKADIGHFARLLNVEPRLYRKTWTITFAGDKLFRILKEIKPYMRGEKLPQVKTILTHGKFYIPKKAVKQPPFMLSLVHPEKLYQYLTMKAKIIPAPSGLKRPTKEEIETMKKLREQGLSLTEIAELVGYTHPTVAKYLRI